MLHRLGRPRRQAAEAGSPAQQLRAVPQEGHQHLCPIASKIDGLLGCIFERLVELDGMGAFHLLVAEVRSTRRKS